MASKQWAVRLFPLQLAAGQCRHSNAHHGKVEEARDKGKREKGGVGDGSDAAATWCCQRHTTAVWDT